MTFEIRRTEFEPQLATVHFTTNKQAEGMRLLWNEGYASFDENVLPGEDAVGNVRALFEHLGKNVPEEFVSLAVRYCNEQRGAQSTLNRYGPYVVEVRHDALDDMLILNGDVKNLANDFVQGATEKPYAIPFDHANPEATLQTLLTLGMSRTNPRLTGNYPEARLLRRLRGHDVLAVWATDPSEDDLAFLKSVGGVEIPVSAPPPKKPPFGRVNS